MEKNLFLNSSKTLFNLDQTDKTSKGSSHTKSDEWLTPEILNLFLYHNIEALSSQYEHEILSKKYKINSQHEKLFEFVNQLRKSGTEDVQTNHLAKFFSLRNLDRLCRKLEKHSNLDLVELIENLTLKKFMPQLNKQLLNEFIKSVDSNLNQTNTNFDFYTKFNRLEKQESNSNDLLELSKIPDILFYENNLRKLILNNLVRDIELLLSAN